MNISTIDDRPPRNPPPLPIASTSRNDTQTLDLENREVAAGDFDRTSEVEKLKEEAVTWMSLPHKSQLAVLTMARLSEPLVQTSLQVNRKAALAVII